MLEFLVRHVFANEVELGLLTIECAVAYTIHISFPLGFGPLFQLGLDGFSRAGFLRAVSDMHQFRCVALKRLGQSLGPLRKQFTVFLLATGASHDQHLPRLGRVKISRIQIRLGQAEQQRNKKIILMAANAFFGATTR